MTLLKQRTKKLSGLRLASKTLEILTERLYSTHRYDYLDVQDVYECFNLCTFSREYYPIVFGQVEEWVREAEKSSPTCPGEDDLALKEFKEILTDYKETQCLIK